MFNVLCNSKTNKILRDGGAGYEERHTFKWTYRENTDGLVTVAGAVVKVSGLTPSFEELKGGTIVASAGSETTTIVIAEVMDLNGAILLCDGIFVVYQDGFVWEDAGGVVFPEKGIYMANQEGFAWELSYGSIHPIDPKYLPEGIGGGLPVVELSTSIYGSEEEAVELTEAESVALTEAASSGMPVIVKVAVTELEMPYVTIVTQNLSGALLAGHLPSMFSFMGFDLILIMLNETGWAARFAVIQQ